MTEKDENFYFRFRRASLPKGGEAITLEEAEEFFLEQLEERDGTCKETLWRLIRVYSLMKRPDDALKYLYKMMQLSDDAEENAHYFLTLGQLMEQKGDYQSAVKYYRGAFCLKPSDNDVWYWVNNNLGFCLNELMRFDEAKGYLLAAIRIDPTRANAYKNLGLCFMGGGDYIKASENFINSVKANASDTRALKHLEELVSDHPELFEEIPGLSKVLMQCRKALKTALESQPDFEKHWKRLRRKKRGNVK
ncbi:MAG TPA: tetratricopeptide repeat protein [Desulfatiglandales bacterium]|nr:tetratricopeptide repeat protein [Desulfatiglandales bacterium]